MSTSPKRNCSRLVPPKLFWLGGVAAAGLLVLCCDQALAGAIGDTGLAVAGGRFGIVANLGLGVRLLVMLAVLSLLPLKKLSAAIYYVRKTGNDGNAGTSAGAAWATFSKAISSTSAGDVVYFGAGTYTEDVEPSVDGTSTDPIRFVADKDGAETGDSGTVTIVGSGKGSSTAVSLDTDDYLEFEGFRITGSSKVGVEVVDSVGGALTKCEVFGSTTGIDVDGSSTTLKITNCLIQGNSAAGIQCTDGDVTIWNCTIADNQVRGVVAGKNNKGGTVSITNSIIAINGNFGLTRDGGALTHTYNLVFGNTSGDYKDTTAGTGEISVDPLFISGSDYHLQEISPAANSGTSSGGPPSDDFDGTLRPFGSGYDMGCFEVVSYTLGYWKFDEGFGSTAIDSSVSTNDATISGATWTSDCSGNNALEFDGVSDSAATDSSFAPPAIGAIEFWTRGAGTPAASGKLLGVDDDWEVRQDTTGKIYFDLGATPLAGNEPFATTAALDEDGRWYHVFAQFNDTDDSYAVYVDGELQSSGTSPVDLVTQSSGTLSVGTRTGSSEYWKGALRELRVYNRWLSESEIAERCGSAGHWQLDESIGTIANDATVNANDGTYQNAPTLGLNSVYVPENGTAVSFDGSNQYVSIPHVDTMLADNGTIMFWFRSTGVNSTQGLLSKDALGFGTGGHLTIQLIAGKVSATLESTTQTYTIESSVVAIGRWNHVTLTWGVGGMVLYVDGQEVANDPSYTGGLGTSSGGSGNYEPLVVASSASISGDLIETPLQDYLTGIVDDIRFYTRVLCNNELRRIYRGSRSPGVRIIQWVEVR